MGGALGEFFYKESPEVDFALEDDTTQYQLYGGYRISKVFGVEGGLTHTNDIDSSFPINLQTSQGTTVPGRLDISASYDIYEIKALGYLPFNLTSLFGGLGYQSASLNGDADIAGIGTVGTLHNHFRGSMAVIGIQRDFRLDLKSISLRGGYTWYDFDKQIDAAGFTIGMIYRF